MNPRATLGIGLGCGVLAAALSYGWLASKERAFEALSSPAPALVAAKFIGAGARLDKTLVTVRQIPRAYIQAGALRSAEEAEGQIALAPFAPGEQILANKLATRGMALALAVSPGKRAVTVSVDAASGVAGLLKPGDLVDVFVTLDEKEPRTFVHLQAAGVLAVGRNFSPQQAPEEHGRFGHEAATDTVTMEMSPYEAEQLTHLEQVGRIKLALRAPGDRERIALPPITGRRAGGGPEAEEVKRR